ncbi:TM0106 family RecB-like putative nuclease [Brevibacterium sp. NPDC049920]|uniref:TM0106 family RecB-like putative nuclease n=1 Tax=Brevibacterium pityocampae TaxID=506594 RepID=A0ABP8IZS3_9MICO
MYIDFHDRVVTSPSDLTAASACEFGFLRRLDEKLGRIAPLAREADPMLERTAELGAGHEARIVEDLRAQGLTVVTLDRPNLRDSSGIEEAERATLAALESGADVVVQAALAGDDGLPFAGFTDFLVRRPDGGWRVQDTKLARSAKVTALLQVAAYAQRLTELGVAVDDEVDLILGDGAMSTHRLSDIAPMYRLRRARLVAMITGHQAEPRPVRWNDPRYTQCGSCPDCEAEIESHRDMWLVYALSTVQRQRLRQAGLQTIDDVAAWQPGDPNGGVPQRTMTKLARQARLQIASKGRDVPVFEVGDPTALHLLPEPSPGDLFFDFEGDPLWTPDGVTWGLDYLFGMVDSAGRFTALWAHSMDEERQALLDFLGLVEQKRAEHPDMHIYHYAPYERTHLLSIAQRHGVGEDRVDELLRQGVLVDLYATVSKSLALGLPSYSIKKLEALHMAGEKEREGVSGGDESIDQYARAVQLRDAGRTEEAQERLADIEQYNAYDCISTLKLRDWLRALALEHPAADGSVPGEHPPEAEVPAPKPETDSARARREKREAEDELRSSLEDELEALAGDPFSPGRTDTERAWGMARAALRYHEREEKGFWWEHFARLEQARDEWAEHRNVFHIGHAEVVDDWEKRGRARMHSRRLALHGAWTDGSSGVPGSGFLLYEHPGPRPPREHETGSRDAVEATDIEEIELDTGGTLLMVTERTTTTFPETYDHLPIALAPGAPPRTDSLRQSILDWVADARENAPDWPMGAAADVLARRPSRLRSGGLAQVSGDDTVGAVVDSAVRLDGSYLAVQGPPGTGKTYLAARAIARLVAERGWKVGVVAQSHAVVDNVLTEIVENGLLEVGAVSKAQSDDRDPVHPDVSVTTTGKWKDEFAAERAGRGYVVGGTAWFFSSTTAIDSGQLDLLVIDEAGQYSLANTIAVSRAARNLMLFGDPQQLPQVSQGSHPEPVDTSALGFLSAGHDVLPAEFGYFLGESRRMDAAVCGPVSRLSYDGRLDSHPSTRARRLAEVRPGLEPIEVRHAGNATSSVEEAEVVVDVVRDTLGARWDDGGGDVRKLDESDVIVVTPYNAQVGTVRAALDSAGLRDVRVGTVDKFQGQQAVVSILTLAASSAAEVPRGISFLLMKNRLNVAISRAKWNAYLVYSPDLLDHLPSTPQALAEMSAFAGLVGE